MKRARLWLPALALAAAAAAWLAGPPSFDAIDGSEFAVASEELSICHPPSYPVFLMLMRMMPGSSYESGRILCCLLAGMIAWLAFSLLEARGASRAGAFLGALLLVSARPVFSQIDCVEVHGLSILLVLAALFPAPGAAGGYMYSLAVFAGHPLSVLLAPLARPLGWGRGMILAALPATLLLYVPLRAGAHTTAHYAHPVHFEQYLSYMGLYSDRLEAPSAGRLGEALGSLGILGGGILGILAAAGRPTPRELSALGLAALALSCYRVPDPDSMLWIALLPAWLPAARGLDRLLARGRIAAALAAVATLVFAAGGIRSAFRSSDDIASTIASDMLRSAPSEAVYCAVGHDVFYTAYLLRIDDRRPDIIPVDLYGAYFDLHLQQPLPSALGQRPVIATRAWDSPGFLLEGLVFSTSRRPPVWEALDIYRFGGWSPDAFARDLVAEAWMRRALQSMQPERSEFAGIAIGWASTGTTLDRVEEALGQD